MKNRHVIVWGTQGSNSVPAGQNAEFEPTYLRLKMDSLGNIFCRMDVSTNSPGTFVQLTATLLNAAGGDAVAPTATMYGQNCYAVPALVNGAGLFDRARSLTVGNMSPTLAPRGIAITGKPAEFSLPHTPAVGVRATVTRAAVAATRHVCTGISATLSVAAADVAVAGVLVHLRDGATGAGTILWSGRLAVVAAGGLVQFALTDLNITGSENTAMTLEFAGAPGAASFETVTLSGYTVQDGS